MANAQEPQAGPRDWNTSIDLRREADKPHATRYFLFRQEETDRVREMYVTGGVTTIIRLPFRLHTRGVGIGGGGGHTILMAFVKVKERFFVDGAGRNITLETYASPPDAPRQASQVAAVFIVTNNGPEPLEITAGRAFRSPDLEHVPLAFRVQPRVIPPGGDGRIAVVLDRASLKQREGGKVGIDFFSKAWGGQIELAADLMPGDFAAPPARDWWPF